MPGHATISPTVASSSERSERVSEQGSKRVGFIRGDKATTVDSSVYPWPQFKDPLLQGQYRLFCEQISVHIWVLVFKIIYFTTYIFRVGITILRLATVKPIFTLGYCLLVIAFATFLFALAFFCAYFSYPSTDLKHRRQMRKNSLLFAIISFSQIFAFAGLKECYVLALDQEYNECADRSAIMYHLLYMGIVGPLMAYVLSSGIYMVSAIAFIAAVVAQIIIVAGDKLVNIWDVCHIIVVIGLCHGLVIRMEFTNMSAFLGKVQEQHVKKLQQSIFESEKEQLRAVLWNVAHDMKTPMQSFLAGIHVVNAIPLKVSNAMKSSTDFKLKREVELVLRQSSSATDEMSASYELLMMQLNRAMDVARLEHDAGEHVPYCIAVNVNEVVKSVINVVTTLQCHRTKIQIEGGFPNGDPLPYVHTSKSWLSDNLLCMVSNAVKYSPVHSNILLQFSICDWASLTAMGVGNAECREETDPRGRGEEGTFLLFQVTDCGLHVLDHAKVFSKLAQVERVVGGTGLGLYALRLRVLCLGGMCGSRPRRDGGEGSVFFFAVPFFAVDANGNSCKLPMGNINCGDMRSLSNDENSSERRSGEHDTLSGLPEAMSLSLAHRNSFSTPMTSFSSGVTMHNTLNCSEPFENSDTFVVETFDHIDNADSSATIMTSCTPLSQAVLIVDDSLSTLKLMARAFKNCGATVMTAVDGKQALEMMQNTEFALVVMDIQMPIMGGIESITLFREWEGSTQSTQTKARNSLHQYIIAASAVSCRSESLDAGADGFYDKPLDIKNLIQLYHSRVSAA
jgi:CheY-like chemotaxis protein/signal transduction histidine kinase